MRGFSLIELIVLMAADILVALGTYQLTQKYHAVFTVSIPEGPLSVIDGKLMAPGSWHSAHVTVRDYSDNFELDDGTKIKLVLWGGTQPHLDEGLKGILYVSVPAYYRSAADDDDSTYFFQKFVPDK